MEEIEKKEIGESLYLNKNCWLVKNLKYPPYKRCQYCEFKFRNCMFMQYQAVSIVLIVLAFSLFFLVEKRLSLLVIGTIFVLVIVYGFFFNRSTEKIVKSNFSLKKTKDELSELASNLESKVKDQTADIEEKRQHVQDLLNMKTDFLRVVNHQLNTPLSIIGGSLSMMDEKSWTIKKTIDAIRNAFKKINQTVSDFWDAYELEGERMKMNPEKVGIAGIVDELISEKKKMQTVEERKLKVLVEKPKFEIPTIWCDFKKLSHAISNLLDNAIFYTTKGSVSVGYELADERHLKILIKDTGSGISGEDKKKLFEKFSRGDKASNLNPNGSGLGLYIAKKIVEGNNGEISFTSEGQGKGTTFSITVPIYKNQISNSSGSKDALSKQKIVIFNKKN